MKNLVFAALVGAALAASPAAAATMTVDAGWQNFYFYDSGTALIDSMTGDTSWSFSLTGNAYLQITDAYLVGDIFELTLNGNSLGTTSTPVDLGYESGAQAAFDAGYYSKGSYLLGAGEYTLTGIATASPFGSGGGYMQLTSASGAVPEPATWAMMIGGFGLVGGALRRRQTMQVAFAA